MISRLDVAILIGCLGAGIVVAVPRHVQIATQTRVAEVATLARGAGTATQLAHSRWLAAGQPQTIAGARGLVAMTHGYPSAATLSLMLAEAETTAFLHDSGVWRHAGLGAKRPCGVAYQPPVSAGQLPVISAHTSGC